MDNDYIDQVQSEIDYLINGKYEVECAEEIVVDIDKAIKQLQYELEWIKSLDV